MSDAEQKVEVKNEEKKEEIKIREMIINIRKQVIKAPLHKRAKKAVKALADAIKRIAKNREVKISARLNSYIWSRGIKKPPTKIPVKIIEKEDKVYVDLNR